MSDIILEAKSIRKTFRLNDGFLEVVRDASLTVKNGEFIAIMGKSGSGKSTLLHLLAGLDTPTSGEVRLDREILTNKSESELAVFRRKHIGFVYQFFNLIHSMTVLENIMMPALLYGVPGRVAYKKAMDLLNSLQIENIAKKLPGVLSGGQRQRTAIARALINQPPIIFADEPTGNLDTNTSDEVMAIFRKLHQQGTTLVLVTHDSKVASQADRILHLQDGQFIDEEIMSNGVNEQTILPPVIRMF